MKPVKDPLLCSVCGIQPVKTDGYYHRSTRDIDLIICVTCHDNGVVWAAQQAYKGKS